MPLPYTTESYIAKATSVHGDRYGYERVVYVHSRKKVEIFCKECKEYFMQESGIHIGGHGCPDCWRPKAWKKTGNKNRMTQEEFISKVKSIYGDKYTYDKVLYTGNKNDVIITCDVHGDIKVNAGNFLREHDCHKCSMIENGKRKKEKAKKEFLKKAYKVHGDKFEYLSEYDSVFKKIKIQCKKCNHIFLQTPSNHLNGYGCSLCKISKGERKIEIFLTENNISFIREARFNDCKGKRKTIPFDFYLPNYNICIEYDGRQHFEVTGFGSSDPKQVYERLLFTDAIKNNYCKEKEIQLIRIPYTQIDEIPKILTKKLNIKDMTFLDTILSY